MFVSFFLCILSVNLFVLLWIGVPFLLVSCILFLYVFDMQFVMLLLDVCLTVLAVCYDTGKNDQAVFWFRG